MISSEPVPELTDPVIGFRTWKLHGDRLCAITALGKFPWPVGDFHARCHAADGPARHSAPVSDCTCGIYARHFHHPVAPISLQRLFGLIVAWGDLELHHSGFRAEWARPVLLVTDDTWSAGVKRRVKRVAARYGLDLVPRERLRVVAAEHGNPVPRYLRPVDPSPVALLSLRGSQPTDQIQRDWVQDYARRGWHEIALWTLLNTNADLILAEARRQLSEDTSLLALLHEGAIGLLRAAEYSHGDLSRFRLQAAWWVRMAVLRAIQRGTVGSYVRRTLTTGQLKADMPEPEPTARQLDLLERLTGREAVPELVPPLRRDEYRRMIRELDPIGEFSDHDWWRFRLEQRGELWGLR